MLGAEVKDQNPDETDKRDVKQRIVEALGIIRDKVFELGEELLELMNSGISWRKPIKRLRNALHRLESR